MSNQICRQSPKAVAVNYMARLFRHRPVRVRTTAEIEAPPSANIVDTNRYVHMVLPTLPLATSLTPHARCCTLAR